MSKPKLLTDESPLQVLPQLAKKIGLYEAMILQQVHYLTTNPNIKKDIKVKVGQRWVKKSYENWQRDYLPFITVPTIKRTIRNLEKEGYLMSAILDHGEDGLERTKWYTVDYDAVAKVTGALQQPKTSDNELDTRMDQNDPYVPNLIPTYSENGHQSEAPEPDEEINMTQRMDQNDPTLLDSLKTLSDSPIESSKPQQPKTRTPAKAAAVVAPEYIPDEPDFPPDPKRDTENKVIDLYKSAYNLLIISPIMIGILRKDALKYPFEWIEQAAEITVTAGKDWRFAQGILKNWHKIGGPENDIKPERKIFNGRTDKAGYRQSETERNRALNRSDEMDIYLDIASGQYIRHSTGEIVVGYGG